ncbi:Ig-like domain-containing protein [Pseudomonas sp. GL-B-26]|uniref:Ig-like domain-containing protein n=1 Tax=unclassified Pseudomonas TaxID=196821 RepID=UPI001CC1A9AE|nr:Ig-like domain-containing protein [Pseudomonas sp. GL-B-26]
MNSPMTNAGPASNQQIVVFPPDRGIGVLAVDPPYPPGFKPQNDGALGININMVYGDRDGLLVYILAYLNMAIGDNIKVYIETKNAPVAAFSVTEAHFDAEGNAKNIPFYISAKDMEAKFLNLGNKDFWFEVQRVSGNPSEGSPPVQMFYKHPAPGEADTDGGKPFNQGLKLPVASESVVDQTVINDGMFVTVLEYFNQSIGDVVVLAFGSLLLETTVTVLGDVVFELTSEMLATLAPTNSLVVRWEVFDVVENSSGWSDALILTFKPGVVLLAAPIFERADPDNVVHHDGLAGEAMVILVTGVFAKNDLIELTLEGLTRGGDPVTHTFSVTLAAASRTVDFPVLNEWVRNLIGGSARATYRLTKAGKTQRSKPADATFTGTSQPLGLPIVDPLVDNKLPVDTATATVRVAEYWPLKKGAIVKLHWQTTDQDGIKALFIFQQIVVDPTQPVIFQVPAKYIAPYASTPLAVQCTVTNPGEVEVFSRLLQLMFGDVAQIVLEPPFLVRPAVSPIDVLAYPEGVTVRIEYLGALDGDRARLVEVNAPAGSPQFPLVAFNSNKRVNTLLTQAFLVARHGKVFEPRWNLNRGGGQAGRSPVVKLSVLKIADGDMRLPTPTIDRASGQELDVTLLQATDQLRVGEWPGQVPRQNVWLEYKGFDANGRAIVFNDMKGEPHDSASGLTRLVPFTWLNTLEDGSELTILLRVNLDGVPNTQTATKFPEQVYRVKAVALITPTINSVKDTKNIEIPQDGTTTDTTVTLAGKATGNLQVEIFDGTTSQGTAQVNASGDWTKQVTGLTVAAHSFTAKGLYGSNPVSTPPRTLTVTRPFVVDTSTMILDGVAVYVNGWVESGNTIENNTKIRQPTSGTPVYTYQSSDPTIVQVSGDGSVTGRRNGTASIKVLDASGQSAEYNVRVTNVYRIVLNSALLTGDQATAWARSQGHINLYPLNDVTSKITTAFSRTYGMYPNPNLRFFPRTEGIDYPKVSNPPHYQMYGWIARTYVVNPQGGKMHEGLMCFSSGGSAIGGASLSHVYGQSAPPFINYQGNAWFTTRSGAFALLTT